VKENKKYWCLITGSGHKRVLNIGAVTSQSNRGEVSIEKVEIGDFPVEGDEWRMRIGGKLFGREFWGACSRELSLKRRLLDSDESGGEICEDPVEIFVKIREN
jgi:hypothetical protein